MLIMREQIIALWLADRTYRRIHNLDARDSQWLVRAFLYRVIDDG